ncbi:MAG: nuclear transport factor 2 family protein [Bacteroidota bacterium]
MRKLFVKPPLIILLSLFTLAADAQKKRNLKQEDANKKLVEHFFYTFYNDKDVEKSRAMMRPDFINHHPNSGKGAEETLQAVNKHLFGKFPQFRVFIKRIVAEGDLVWIQCYTQNTPDDRGNMSMDIFRVRDGKIAEHWDIIEAVPEGIDPASMYN